MRTAVWPRHHEPRHQYCHRPRRLPTHLLRHLRRHPSQAHRHHRRIRHSPATTLARRLAGAPMGRVTTVAPVPNSVGAHMALIVPTAPRAFDRHPRHHRHHARRRRRSPHCQHPLHHRRQRRPSRHSAHHRRQRLRCRPRALWFTAKMGTVRQPASILRAARSHTRSA